MKITINKPEPSESPWELQIGNVYKAKGGNKTKYWVVLSVSETAVHLIGVNDKAEITQAATYGRHVFDNSCKLFKRREIIGFASGLTDVNLVIDLYED